MYNFQSYVNIISLGQKAELSSTHIVTGLKYCSVVFKQP